MTPTEILQTKVAQFLAAQPRTSTFWNIPWRAHLVISGEGGGEWSIDTTTTSNWVSTGLVGDENVRIEMSSDNLVALSSGRVTIDYLLETGKTRFSASRRGDEAKGILALRTIQGACR